MAAAVVKPPTFDEVKAAALDQIESLCAKLLPRGRVKGNSYISPVPWRDDRNPSLSVLLSTACWKDWGQPGEGGSIIDLVMKIDGCDKLAARDTLAALCGISKIESKARKAAPVTSKIVKSCGGCKYWWERYPDADYCTRCVDQITEEPLRIDKARHYHGECGPEAKLYRAKT